jgi:hypothetical protein
MAEPRRTVTHAFRKRMFRDAAIVLAGLAFTLFVLATSVPSRAFLITACILIPCAALTFNLMTRRAYAAHQSRKR